MMNKKELEIELAMKGADALKPAFELNEKTERKIFEFEKRLTKLESKLEHVVDCLESNASIIKMMNEKMDKFDGI